MASRRPLLIDATCAAARLRRGLPTN